MNEERNGEEYKDQHQQAPEDAAQTGPQHLPCAPPEVREEEEAAEDRIQINHSIKGKWRATLEPLGGELTVEDLELIVHQDHPQHPCRDIREGHSEPYTRRVPEQWEEEERRQKEEDLTRETQEKRLPPEADTLEELRSRDLEAYEGKAIETEA